MEEIFSLILNGCKLAKDLEANLPNIANQPETISRSCDEIIKSFYAAKERLNDAHHHQAPAALFYPPAAAAETLFHEQQQQQQQIIDASLQEWLRSSVTQTMSLMQTQHFVGRTPFYIGEMGAKEMEGTSTTRLRSFGGDHHHHHHNVQPMDVSDSSRASSSSQPRHRRSGNARTTTVPAPQIGNTEIPPEDGYTWRKYGQKEILNSKHPRSYYRCTHQKLYKCPAKKQVQRLDDDPSTFEVVYYGDHTCHMSATAPSMVPASSSAEITQGMTTQQSVTVQQPSSTSNIGRWLTMDVAAGGSSTGAGPSTVRYEREVPGDYLVANMADAMFNSGSSSSNSMEFLFSCSNVEEKGHPEDKKE